MRDEQSKAVVTTIVYSSSLPSFLSAIGSDRICSVVLLPRLYPHSAGVDTPAHLLFFAYPNAACAMTEHTDVRARYFGSSYVHTILLWTQELTVLSGFRPIWPRGNHRSFVGTEAMSHRLLLLPHILTLVQPALPGS